MLTIPVVFSIPILGLVENSGGGNEFQEAANDSIGREGVAGSDFQEHGGQVINNGEYTNLDENDEIWEEEEGGWMWGNDFGENEDDIGSSRDKRLVTNEDGDLNIREKREVEAFPG